MRGMVEVGEFVTISVMALALSMDAFSVCIGLGMKGIRLRQVAKVSMLIGLFHMLMPFIGIHIGLYLSYFVGSLTFFIGGCLLIIFGLNMIYSSLFGVQRNSWFRNTGWGMVLLAFGVSMDSFSIGLSLGLFSVNVWLSIICFGLAGLCLTAIGLLIGRKVNTIIGDYGEIVGGIILLVFGIRFLL